ncbi:MAG: hypothetical protein STSR0003_07480 [Smithella sp.]|jgi:hypothetical protein
MIRFGHRQHPVFERLVAHLNIEFFNYFMVYKTAGKGYGLGKAKSVYIFG